MLHLATFISRAAMHTAAAYPGGHIHLLVAAQSTLYRRALQVRSGLGGARAALHQQAPHTQAQPMQSIQFCRYACSDIERACCSSAHCQRVAASEPMRMACVALPQRRILGKSGAWHLHMPPLRYPGGKSTQRLHTPSLVLSRQLALPLLFESGSACPLPCAP